MTIGGEVRRRDLLGASTLLPFGGPAMVAWLTTSPAVAESVPFDGSSVRGYARDLAAKPYQAPASKLPDAFSKLGYDRYRDIRFDPGQSLWRGKGLPFEVQFFHRGFLYKDRVEIHEVADGKATRIRYNPEAFALGDLPRPSEDLGFAGFRIHAPLNKPEYFDEICAFLGASYFRAVAKNQAYGLSARGLAINTAEPKGEEFPVFKAFWLERPQPRSGSIVVHALLDGPSAAGAFRFTIRPGDATVFDVESTIYPRVDIAHVGLAPLTSMFYFGPHDRNGIDDYRPAVHDSDGLLIWSGWGEQLWRPLQNPTELQISTFTDDNPRAFGLMQRRRDYAHYKDLEARYERRPALWVEPIGNAGTGAVHLVEIPTNREIHDNIAAFWRPAQPLKAKSEFVFNYRLHWCNENPWPSELAKVVETRTGAGGQEKSRLFIVEFVGEKLKSLPQDAKPQAELTVEKAKFQNLVLQPNPETGGYRASFELIPGGARNVELRLQLKLNDAVLSEAWLYRWTA
jgi:periplasmic glucans biosynthesis protein